MNKIWFRGQISKYERDVQELFYKQLMFKTSKIKALRQAQETLNRLAKRIGLTKNETDLIWEQTHGLYLTMQHKSSYVRNNENKANILALVLDDKQKRLQMTQILNKIEARKKSQELDKLISKGKSPFYLCSSHRNPATDHKDYQGKIYINQDWRDKVRDREMQDKIRAYIRNHKIRTIEWVIGEPVYMTTRPNCKHYFVNVDINAVLSSSAKALCKRLGMIVDEKMVDKEKQKEIRLKRERARINSLRKIYDCTVLKEQRKKVGL